MARYEGMDEILQRVRERLEGAEESSVGLTGEHSTRTHAPLHQQACETARENLLSLVRDAERLRQTLTTGHFDDLSREQHNDLQSMLGTALQELLRCEALLKRLSPPD
ncbi:MAG: hypothetical protein NVS2B16_08530 [Chloroflexota bacterium]